jgi:hypothetical protein
MYYPTHNRFLQPNYIKFADAELSNTFHARGDVYHNAKLETILRSYRIIVVVQRTEKLVEFLKDAASHLFAQKEKVKVSQTRNNKVDANRKEIE